MRKSQVAALAAALLAALLAAAPRAAESNRTLRVAFNTAESGFDPQAVNDNYSYMVCDAIFDSLYTYDYFARPPRLIPNTAAALPEITDGGRTFTIRVQPGIYFADDPAFSGRRRKRASATCRGCRATARGRSWRRCPRRATSRAPSS